MTIYTIDSWHEKSDGTLEQVRTSRGTSEGLEYYLDCLDNDLTCVKLYITEKEVEIKGF